MKLQFSAGGIVYKKDEDKVFILVSQHSQHHGWVFPKGLIGDHVDGENKEQTALREVKEETGVEGKIIKALTPVTYWFKLSRQLRDPAVAGESELIKKTVYYFLMEHIGGDIAKHDHEMETVVWLPKEKVKERLTYKSDKQVWEQAIKLI